MSGSRASLRIEILTTTLRRSNDWTWFLEAMNGYPEYDPQLQSELQHQPYEEIVGIPDIGHGLFDFDHGWSG